MLFAFKKITFKKLLFGFVYVFCSGSLLVTFNKDLSYLFYIIGNFPEVFTIFEYRLLILKHLYKKDKWNFMINLIIFFIMIWDIRVFTIQACYIMNQAFGLIVFDTIINIYSVTLFKLFFYEWINIYSNKLITYLFKMITSLFKLIDIYEGLLSNILNIYLYILTYLDYISKEIIQFVNNVINCDYPKNGYHYSLKDCSLYIYIMNKYILDSEIYRHFINTQNIFNSIYLCTENPTESVAGVGGESVPVAETGAIAGAGAGAGVGGELVTSTKGKNPDYTVNSKLPQNVTNPLIEKSLKNTELSTVKEKQFKPSESQKKEYLKLKSSGSEIFKSIKDNNDTIEEIKLAIKLHKKLPDAAKHKNTHLDWIKEEFSSFFDEDSGNRSIGDSLHQIIDYVKEENSSLKIQLDKVKKEIKDLISDSKNQAESSKNNVKPDVSTSYADTDNKTYIKKNTLNDDGDDNNNRSGSSSS